MLLARVEEYIRRHDLIPPGGEVTCLVSGGADSTCLWHVLRELDYRVSALHVNHKLRGAESEEDARFCSDVLGAEVVELDGTGLTEAELREQRYSVARDRLRATGHTASDQVETILYRLASSPSRRALLGMRPRDGRLARPLLGTTRAETTAYCEQRGLPWRDDPSNAEADYKRNLVRREVVPALEKIHPAAKGNVLRTAALLRSEAELLDSLVDAELEGGEGAPAGCISHRRFAELHPALRRLVLQRLADEAAGRPVAGASRFAEQVAGLTRGGSALDLGDGIRAVLEGGVLRAERS